MRHPLALPVSATTTDMEAVGREAMIPRNVMGFTRCGSVVTTASAVRKWMMVECLCEKCVPGRWNGWTLCDQCGDTLMPGEVWCTSCNIPWEYEA